MWNNKDPTHGLVRTRYMQEPKMAMLCNNKVTRTRTISNATGYSMYTWKASPTETPISVAAPATHAKTVLDGQFFVTDQTISMTKFLGSSWKFKCDATFLTNRFSS